MAGVGRYVTRARAMTPMLILETPDSMPHAFAEAWNARDADRLAALFEADAEFVNVTGLWWHDREAIRKAHAYGLGQIFNESTLIVATVRVKPLAPDVAVVHARIRLSGQSPVDGLDKPGERITIFSFVMRRGDTGWVCASAHNTDVVPGMETHLAGPGGLAPTRYQPR